MTCTAVTGWNTYHSAPSLLTHPPPPTSSRQTRSSMQRLTVHLHTRPLHWSHWSSGITDSIHGSTRKTVDWKILLVIIEKINRFAYNSIIVNTRKLIYFFHRFTTVTFSTEQLRTVEFIFWQSYHSISSSPSNTESSSSDTHDQLIFLANKAI